jgi:hypothetical protein
MDRRARSSWDQTSLDADMLAIDVVHAFPMDDLEMEIGEDRYGNLFIHARGSEQWITCVGLEDALAQEILRLLRDRDEKAAGVA